MGGSFLSMFDSASAPKGGVGLVAFQMGSLHILIDDRGFN
jgi:hypothetical protein